MGSLTRETCLNAYKNSCGVVTKINQKIASKYKLLKCSIKISFTVVVEHQRQVKREDRLVSSKCGRKIPITVMLVFSKPTKNELNNGMKLKLTVTQR